MSPRSRTNLSRIAREYNLGRATIYRYLRAETKPRASTLRKLREAGLVAEEEMPLLVPPNIRAFARQRNIPFQEVESLMNVGLKPVERMTLQELQWVYESLSKFRDLLTWHGSELVE